MCNSGLLTKISGSPGLCLIFVWTVNFLARDGFCEIFAGHQTHQRTRNHRPEALTGQSRLRYHGIGRSPRLASLTCHATIFVHSLYINLPTYHSKLASTSPALLPTVKRNSSLPASSQILLSSSCLNACLRLLRRYPCDCPSLRCICGSVVSTYFCPLSCFFSPGSPHPYWLSFLPPFSQAPF
jgi:hypothetical protein